MNRRRLRRVRNRRAFLVIAVCALAAAPLAAQAAGPSPPASPPAPTPPSSLVVALGLHDPAMAAGVVRGGAVVLARGFEVELAKLLARRLALPLERFVELRPPGACSQARPAAGSSRSRGSRPRAPLVRRASRAGPT